MKHFRKYKRVYKGFRPEGMGYVYLGMILIVLKIFQGHLWGNSNNRVIKGRLLF